MSIVRQEEYERLITIYQCRGETGLQALRAQLFARRDKLNGQWFNMTGDDLTRMAGEAKAVADMIKIIDVQPTIREGTKS